MTINNNDLQRRLDTAASQSGTPGASLCVMHEGQTFSVATGVVNAATGVETTNDSLFQIGSVTKPVTAMQVLSLVDAGKLELDAPIGQWIPDLAFAGVPVPESLTVRTLMTHSSGIDGDLFVDTGRNADCLARYIDRCRAVPLVAPPGAHYSYSNAGYAFLGRIGELVSGKEWDSAILDDVLRPIGAGPAETLPEQALRYRNAVGHDWDPKSRRSTVLPDPGLPRALGPAGFTLRMTAQGLVELLHTLLNDGVASNGHCLLTAATAEAARSRQIELIDGTAWGLGWKIQTTQDGRKLIGHDGGVIGQGAFLWSAPDTGLCIGLTYNGGDAGQLAEQLLPPLFSELADIRMPEDSDHLADRKPVELARYAGSYFNIGMRLDVTVAGDHLKVHGTSGNEGHPDVDFTMHPVNEAKFIGDLGPGGGTALMGFVGDDGSGHPGWLYAGRLHRRDSE